MSDGSPNLFTVYISETFSGYVNVEADSKDEAEERARELLDSGLINPCEDFDGDCIIEAEKYAEESDDE